MGRTLWGVIAVAAAMVCASAAYAKPPAASAGDPMLRVGNAVTPYATSGSTGYWVFVCNAAKTAGYTGKLNKAFEPRIVDRDMRVLSDGSTKNMYPSSPRYEIDQTDPTYPIKRLDASSTDLNAAVDIWDDCDSSNADPSFGIKRNTAFEKVVKRYDYNNDGVSQGTIRTDWTMAFKDTSSLEIGEFYLNDEIKITRPTESVTWKPLASFDDRWNPGWDAGWVVYRDLPGDRAADQIRYCRYRGMFADGRYANTWWKNITSDDVSTYGAGYVPDNFSTQIGGDWDSPFFKNKAGIDSDKLAHEYWENMTGSGSNTSPDSVCRIAWDGDDAASNGEWYWSDPSQRINGLSMVFNCAEERPSRSECRGLGDGPGLHESGAARDNVINFGQSVMARGVLMFMKDRTRPSVSITGGTLDRNGGLIAKRPTSSPDNLSFTATDDAGIRRVQISVRRPDGTTVVVRDVENRTSDGELCDYRFVIPCAGGLSGSNDGDGTPDNRPVWVPRVQAAMLGDYVVNGQELPAGSYTVTVTAWDASNLSASDTATFRADNPRNTRCDGTDQVVTDPAVMCGHSGNVCGTSATCMPAGGTATETAFTGPFAPDPTSGPGIFTYTLASNAAATGANPAGGGCKVIESVIRGNGEGGGLSDREKNQIISITLDFSGFTTFGNALGTQDMKATFDLPSRRDTRYRTALGCPG